MLNQKSNYRKNWISISGLRVCIPCEPEQHKREHVNLIRYNSQKHNASQFRTSTTNIYIAFKHKLSYLYSFSVMHALIFFSVMHACEIKKGKRMNNFSMQRREVSNKCNAMKYRHYKLQCIW